MRSVLAFNGHTVTSGPRTFGFGTKDFPPMYLPVAPLSTTYSYGLATFIKVHAGARDAFVEVLSEVASVACQSPGCLEYIISRVPNDPDGVFVTEFWRNFDDQRGALQLPAITALIERCAPLIDYYDQKPLEPVA
ncbi:antibiotic biosynthesis monooxygenase [Pseudoxanthomonas sp. KAs_5_3]|nr:antibiotic biosynthesis monooxygenase [Pseudoxanthomonas sp. KAs_5_3]